MSASEEQRSAENFKIWYKDDGQAYLIVNEQEVLVEPVKGRIGGTRREYQATGSPTPTSAGRNCFLRNGPLINSIIFL